MNYINFFGLQLDINRVAFTIPIFGGWDVYWYGIIITFGFVLAIIYGMKRAKSFGINPDDLLTAIIITAILAILSGRLYYVIFSPTVGIESFFNIHGGGMAIPGAILGAVLFGAITCKFLKIDILSAFDLMAIGFFIGQSIGRWGNFINQEAYGSFTGSSWFGMTGDIIAKEMQSARLVHPCFLYESIWCLFGFVLLHIFSYRRKFKGELGCIYMIWYGFGRMIIEGLRTDALPLGAVRVTQWLMGAAFVGGIVLLIVGFSMQKRRLKQASEHYEDQFDKVEVTSQDITDESEAFESTLGITDEDYLDAIKEENNEQ